MNHPDSDEMSESGFPHFHETAATMTDNASAKQDLAHADIGIVGALPIELAPFFDQCDKVRKYTGGDFTFHGGRFEGLRIVWAESGVGFVRARRATQALIEAHTPLWILSCGLSGALLPEMKIGNIVVATSIADTHGHRIAVDVNMPADRAKGLYCGQIVTADTLVRTVKEKQALAESTESIAVDMESLAVAQVAIEAKRGFLAVRSISDDLSADLPPEVLSVVGATGMTRLGAAFSAAWNRPGSVKEMWHLREAAHTAAAKLAVFLRGVIVQLGETLPKQPD